MNEYKDSTSTGSSLGTCIHIAAEDLSSIVYKSVPFSYRDLAVFAYSGQNSNDIDIDHRAEYFKGCSSHGPGDSV
jgi:hypothetical protein